ncbi:MULTISPECIES: acyl-CoA thioesterase [Psychrobacillus]|uniref:Acyl-CoA thioesterase n=1 Tax=Psychrobacillus faecigallinarum TaxID=2762235 RepID=A0ABR8R650_9BACI|nr:thioesterase family protein [Psychrobacillus faecigallinarum]MBD7943275.1 acyl-CoA thioesterase [Psychrobacillus faecigallinarum]QGM31237.1 acyl-CoA thioesterase [Bacillus sp. N3536]
MYQTIVEPRVSETDGVGHINNTTVPVWLEGGRNKLFSLFMPDLSFSNWKMIILKTTVEYKAQIYFGTSVEIKCWVKRIGNTSLELYEEIWQGNKLTVQANTIYVNYNVQENKSEIIPDHIREELERHLYIEQ